MLEETAQPSTPTAQAAPTREQRVASAVQDWADELARLGHGHPGGHDPLRAYRDLPLGTLDLTHAHPSGLAMLFAGRPTRLTDLVREPGALADARRRARAIAAKSAELSAERGLAACWLAVGVATWAAAGRPALVAPVLLRSCVLRPLDPAGDDFDVDLGPDVELNPALVHDLASGPGVELVARDVVDPTLTAARFDPVPALQRVARACSGVAGFRVEQRLVVSTFTAAALELSSDVSSQVAALARHDVVAALAGDPDARAAIAAGPVRAPAPDPDPRSELVVLDIDAGQQAVVDAVRGGQHVVVDAPPGTGRTQTVAAVVAALAADGRRTLLVSQKRAALDAVAHRLQAVGLADLVLSLPDGGSGRGRVAADLTARVQRAVALAGATDAAPAGLAQGTGSDPDQLPRTLEDRRSQLTGHVAALHDVRDPWEVSAYDAQLALAQLTARHPAPRSRVRVRGEALDRLTRPALAELAADLRAAADAGAFAHGPDEDPWFGADLPTSEDVEQALRTVSDLVTKLPRARQRVTAALADAGMPMGGTLAECGSTLELMASVRQTLDLFSTAVWDTSLADAVAATASAEWREANGVAMDWWQRRGLVRQARQLLRPGPAPTDLHAALALAHEQRQRWQELAGPGARPRLPAGLTSAQQAYADVERPLAWLAERLAGTAAGGELLQLDLDDLAARLDRLRAESQTLEVAPRRTQLHRRLVAAGLEPLLTDLADRGVGADDVGAELELVWWTSLLEHVAATDPRYGRHDGELLRAMALEYAAADRAHVSAGAARVGAAVSERLARVVHQHPEQAQQLHEEATRVRGHRSVRDLVASCPDVVAAAAPVWAVSPLAVPAVLPPGAAFDVVVVEEASRLTCAAAVPALSRARQVVVVGDVRQLGPREFSTTVSTGTDGEPVADGPRGAASTGAMAGGAVVGGVVAGGHGDAAVATAGAGDEAGAAAVAREEVTDGAEADDASAGAAAAGAAGREGVVPGAQEGGGPGAESSSVLDALREVLPVASLRTEYRCHDEALVGFADDRVYEGRLLTVPAAQGGQEERAAVALELVEGTGVLAPGADAVESTDPEVARVVELVLQHARARPEESLGVVTLGRSHAERVREALRLAMPGAPDVAGWLTADGPEAFFVKAADDVQGDTRDSVLLSVGYGRTPHGRVLHRFGAVSEAGGERLVAVAATRARRRMLVVSSFAAADLDPARLSAPGPRLLRDLLAWAESGGGAAEVTAPVVADVDPLLADLAARLRSQGLRVQERYGRSADPIDLAVGEDGGPLLVAVEADGPAYARVGSTRDRDRLRVEHLQRLGWTHLRLWTTDVFRDPAREVARVVSVVRAAAARERQRVAGATGARPGAANGGADLRWESVRWDSDRPPVAPTALPRVTSGARPSVPVGRPIEEYTEDELDEVVAWIRADSLARTDEQVAALARQHLGFVRRGSRVDAALFASIERVARARQAAMGNS